MEFTTEELDRLNALVTSSLTAQKNAYHFGECYDEVRRLRDEMGKIVELAASRKERAAALMIA